MCGYRENTVKHYIYIDIFLYKSMTYSVLAKARIFENSENVRK